MLRLLLPLLSFYFFFFNDTPTTDIYTLSLHDALPISLIPDGHFTGASSLRGRHLPVPRASAPRTQPRARGVGRARPRLLAAARGLRDPRDTRHGGLPPPG